MAVAALTGATCYVHGYDFSGDLTEFVATMSGESLDRSNFRSAGWRELTGGLKSVELSTTGWWQSDTSAAVDPQSFPELGIADRVHTLAYTETETTPAYILQAGKFQYRLGGTHGELAPFSLVSRGTNGVGVQRGQLAKAKGNVSATGALGSGVNLGAVGASQFLYGSFHVFSAGTTITVVLESDDNSGFTTATTQATLGPITTTGGTWATRVAGAITDTWFRYRVSAITGTFSVAGAIAIG